MTFDEWLDGLAPSGNGAALSYGLLTRRDYLNSDAQYYARSIWERSRKHDGALEIIDAACELMELHGMHKESAYMQLKELHKQMKPNVKVSGTP